MLYVLIGLSALFLILPFIVSEKSAPYLLSGYNMLSKEEQQKVDIKSYFGVFRKFHWVLGSTFLVFGLSLYYFLSSTATVLFLGIYPLAAYIIFFMVTMKFFYGALRTYMWVGMIVISGSAVFVGYLFYNGLNESTLSIQNQTIVIAGNYGERIDESDIGSIQLVNHLPKLSARTNGFSTGDVKKGYFKTIDGETVKLFMHSRQTPVIVIEKKSGKRIFYSLDSDSNQALFQQLSGAFPATIR